MTPRKELFVKILEALKNISELELIDLNRNQFNQPKENFPSLFTAALIKINEIKWENMVEQQQEGIVTIDVDFFSLDGFMQQTDGTKDDENGLTEIDIIDKIVENLQGLKGEHFKPLNLSNERDLDLQDVQMSYQLSFTTTIYRYINKKYITKKLTLTPQ